MKVYLVVRVHGLIQHLLEVEDYLSLTQGTPTSKITKEYGELFKEGIKLNESLKIISRKFIERVNFLMSVAPSPSYSTFFRAFLNRIELENIKAKLRLLHGRPFLKAFPYYPYEWSLPLSNLLRISSLSDFIEVLSKTLYGLDLKKLHELKKEVKLELLEACLDSSYYYYLKRISKKVDRNVKRLVEYETTLKFVYWLSILGEKSMLDVINNGLLRGLAPFPSKKSISEEMFRKAVDELLNDINFSYASLQRKMTLDTLQTLYKAYLERTRAVALKNKLSFAYVYYYLLLCELEMRNLIKIVVGKWLELPRKTILDTLILLQP